jgi:hypothetical protein
MAATGYTTVSAANLTDASGAIIKRALIRFAPTLTSGQPTAFCVNRAGQASKKPIDTQVLNGAFSVDLADTTLTSPVNICYCVSVLAGEKNELILGGPGSGYDKFQPTGSAVSFDTFQPQLTSLPTGNVITGPKGDTGDAGAAGAQGPAGATGAAGAPGAAGTPATPNTATAPLTIAGNNIALAKSTAGVDGYLAAADFTAFAAKQAALGYTPLNPANNLSDVAVAAAARTNLGLGTLAVANAAAPPAIGTTTPAAGVFTSLVASSLTVSSISTADNDPLTVFDNTLAIGSQIGFGTGYSGTAGNATYYLWWHTGNNSGFGSLETFSNSSPLRIASSYAVSSGPLIVDSGDANGSIAPAPAAGIALQINAANHTAVATVSTTGVASFSNMRSIYTGSVSLTGSTLAAVGNYDTASVAIASVMVGCICIPSYADGSKIEAGVKLEARCAVAGTVIIERTALIVGAVTSTKTVNVRVIL